MKNYIVTRSGEGEIKLHPTEANARGIIVEITTVITKTSQKWYAKILDRKESTVRLATMQSRSEENLIVKILDYARKNLFGGNNGKDTEDRQRLGA